MSGLTGPSGNLSGSGAACLPQVYGRARTVTKVLPPGGFPRPRVSPSNGPCLTSWLGVDTTSGLGTDYVVSPGGT